MRTQGVYIWGVFRRSNRRRMSFQRVGFVFSDKSIPAWEKHTTFVLMGREGVGPAKQVDEPFSRISTSRIHSEPHGFR